MNQPLILASASPRRRELLALLGLPFDCRVADLDESPLPGEPPTVLVRRLSLAKAEAIAEGLAQGRATAPGWIIASDTVVVLGDRILGKPADAAEAIRMLHELRNAPHAVYSGLALWDAGKHRHVVDVAATQVWMRDYTDAEIADYVTSRDPLDKAGAYAIQNTAFRPVARIDGCFASVMGLPLCHLYSTLRAWGEPPPHTPVLPCRAFTDYDCQVHQSILGIATGAKP